MKFDFAIGNPPYQDESERNNGYAAPVYHHFIDEAYKIADTVELIHPARFLFNAGSTPKEWNRKMLEDSHLRVLQYENNSASVFPGVDIKGGVAITIRDKTKQYGPVLTFTAYHELNAILKKVLAQGFESLSNETFVTAKFNFETLFKDYPECEKILKERRLATNVLDLLDNKVFFATKPNNYREYIRVYGRVNNKRDYRWIKKSYIDAEENLHKYKVFLPKVNGTGQFGELLADPTLGYPEEINTHTFMSIGSLDTEEEGRNLLKYLKTKFTRAMWGVLKITQHNSNETWKYVPIQSFTEASDITWNTSIKNIDKQLYKKYNLTDEEIDFIETHVKEME